MNSSDIGSTSKEIQMGNKAVRVIKVLLVAVVAATVLGFVVKGLWNALMPQLFGWHTLTFWQALGLLILSKIFFGGFHRHSGRNSRWKRRMKERWELMSPEERERFRQGMRCGRRPFDRTVQP
jgi:Ca2+/H+ antiporter, TMEM165/GDT1 family